MVRNWNRDMGSRRRAVSGNISTNTTGAALRRTAATAVTVFVLLIPAALGAQRNVSRPSAPRSSAPQIRQAQPRMQQQRPFQQRPMQQNRQFQSSPQFENRAAPGRPGYQGPAYSQPGGQNAVRPAMGMESQRGGQPQAMPRAGSNLPAQNLRPGEPGASVRPAFPSQQPNARYPGAAPPGHLGSWLNQHGNLPVQGQQQLLRNDPSFERLPQADQQRLMQQLQQVNQLPEQERQRRLARAETIERMNPQERMQLNQSTRQLGMLPADRQAVVKRAFRDLRGVPIDQRDTVLNSERYQGQFSPQERGILNNLLRAEPYQPVP